MKLFRKAVPLAFAALTLFCGGANAAVVNCAGSVGQLRITSVDPGLVGGVCLTGLGNFNPADAESWVGTATGLTATHLDKDEAGDVAGPNETWLTGFSSALSGNWTVSDAAWNVYQRLFLGFHFGNAAGAGGAGDPDWFIVELARSDNVGTWALTGPVGVQLNNLSHIDLVGAGSCTANPTACGGPGGGTVPEPASLALAGLALLASVAASRRRT